MDGRLRSGVVVDGGFLVGYEGLLVGHYGLLMGGRWITQSAALLSV